MTLQEVVELTKLVASSPWPNLALSLVLSLVLLKLRLLIRRAEKGFRKLKVLQDICAKQNPDRAKEIYEDDE